MNFKENLIELFAFTRGERKGILIVLILLCALISYRYLAPLLDDGDNEHLLPVKEQIASWSAQLARDSMETDAFDYSGVDDKTIIAAKPFPFDPNTISDEEWLKLGLHRGQIKSIRNFLAKGGVFRIKKDLSRMYVISQQEYERLYPFIQLPEENTYATQRDFQTSNTQSYNFPQSGKKDFRGMIEINSADTNDFRKLKGIGAYLSRKIIAYRDKLGGFYTRDQLKEVYHMDPLRIDSLSAQLITDTSLVRRMHINQIDAQALSSHPYITKQQARALIAYRDQHGPFKSVADIRKSVLIDEKTYQKIAPYLTVD